MALHTHPGFKAVQNKIAKQLAKKSGGKVTKAKQQAAGAILAASSRRASAGAKKANPRLSRVKGKAKRTK